MNNEMQVNETANIFGHRFFKYIIEGNVPAIRLAEPVNLKRQAQYEARRDLK